MTPLIFIAYFLLGVVVDALATFETKATADIHIKRMVIFSGLKGHITEYAGLFFLFYLAITEQNIVWLVAAAEGTVLGSMYGSYLAGRHERKIREEKKEKRKQMAREKSKTKKIKVKGDTKTYKIKVNYANDLQTTGS